jgi:hypothetical protein
MADRTLIDEALAAVAAAEPVGAADQIPLTPEQALVWMIYLKVRDQHQGRASGGEIEHVVRAAMDGGISADEVEAAIAAAGGKD